MSRTNRIPLHREPGSFTRSIFYNRNMSYRKRTDALNSDNLIDPLNHVAPIANPRETQVKSYQGSNQLDRLPPNVVMSHYGRIQPYIASAERISIVKGHRKCAKVKSKSKPLNNREEKIKDNKKDELDPPWFKCMFCKKYKTLKRGMLNLHCITVHGKCLADFKCPLISDQECDKWPSKKPFSTTSSFDALSLPKATKSASKNKFKNTQSSISISNYPLKPLTTKESSKDKRGRDGIEIQGRTDRRLVINYDSTPSGIQKYTEVIINDDPISSSTPIQSYNKYADSDPNVAISESHFHKNSSYKNHRCSNVGANSPAQLNQPFTESRSENMKRINMRPNVTLNASVGPTPIIQSSGIVGHGFNHNLTYPIGAGSLQSHWLGAIPYNYHQRDEIGDPFHPVFFVGDHKRRNNLNYWVSNMRT